MLTPMKYFLTVVSVFVWVPMAYGQVGNQTTQAGQGGQVSSTGEISSQTANQGFVGGGGIGGDPRAASSQASMGGAGGMGGFGGMGGMGRGMMGGMFGGQQQQQPGANLRFPFVVKFQVRPIVVANVKQKAQTRLTKLPGLSRFNKVVVDLEQSTATLTGEVVSEREKSLIERLVLLEPGINSVNNNLGITEKQPEDN